MGIVLLSLGFSLRLVPVSAQILYSFVHACMHAYMGVVKPFCEKKIIAFIQTLTILDKSDQELQVLHSFTLE
jgi:hypothetical protein